MTTRSLSKKWRIISLIIVYFDTRVKYYGRFCNITHRQISEQKGSTQNKLKARSKPVLQSTTSNKITPEIRADKKRIKRLEKELHRKDKALAEAAVLLVLGKKFTAYLGESEDS